MDFGFGPAGDAHIADLRQMFSRRANTTLINARGVDTVRQLINHLNSSTSKPIGDILLGAHANDEGQLFLPAFPGQRGPTNFETLESTLSNASRSIKIPDALIGYTAASGITHAVHIQGCNIGNALPFLTKFKDALGGHVNVTAPKFFHGATPAPQGSFEYMGYQFAIRRATPFPNRAVALAEFDAEQFTLIDGKTVVPTADWKTLIPRNPNVTVKQQAASKLGAAVGTRTTIQTPRQYRATQITFGPWTITYPSASAIPSSQSARLSDLEASLKTDARFQDTHPFPQFIREGFPRVIEFVSGYTWTCVPRGRTLVCVGKRMLYVAALAITDPATAPTHGFFGDGDLIFNFYPAARSSLTPITNALQVTDATYFATV